MGAGSREEGEMRDVEGVIRDKEENNGERNER